MKKKDLLKKLEELESRVAALESELERARQKPDVVMPYIGTGVYRPNVWAEPAPVSTQKYIISSDPTASVKIDWTAPQTHSPLDTPGDTIV